MKAGGSRLKATAVTKASFCVLLWAERQRSKKASEMMCKWVRLPPPWAWCRVWGCTKVLVLKCWFRSNSLRLHAFEPLIKLCTVTPFSATFSILVENDQGLTIFGFFRRVERGTQRGEVGQKRPFDLAAEQTSVEETRAKRAFKACVLRSRPLLKRTHL